MEYDGEFVREVPVPPAYYYYRHIKEWGFPNEGTWLDQPFEFMQDLYAAERAINEWRVLEEFNRDQSND